MALIVQLSDLHLMSGDGEQPEIVRALVGALKAECRRRVEPVRLLVITGDIFGSSSLDVSRAVGDFEALHDRITGALGANVPTVIVPGNHDRRRGGLLAPFSGELFNRLRDALGPKAFVHGCSVPFLAEVVPAELHGLPLFVIAYDSTYLPEGLLSAGGMLRQEDLLQAASVIEGEHLDYPVLFLLHHHLVPTPLTDVGLVEVEHSPRLVRWAVQHLLPSLVSNADREEMTMTALGAGTALSTLHALRRAVVVLHGHKHYANARLLQGTGERQGDVLLVSAGSSGTAQSWFPTTARDSARLWPSFNVVEIDDEGVRVDVVSFGHRGEAMGERAVRPLVRAARRAERLRCEPVNVRGETGGPHRLEKNELFCRLLPSPSAARWDCVCERMYEGGEQTSPASFMDTVDALEDSALHLIDEAGRLVGSAKSPPTLIELVRNGRTRYRIDGGLPRTVPELRRLFGMRAVPFAWMGILNRYASRRVHLRVDCGNLGALRGGFASETDLGTGLQRPLPRSRGSTDSLIVIDYPDCPPRTLIRIYWPLEGE